MLEVHVLVLLVPQLCTARQVEEGNAHLLLERYVLKNWLHRLSQTNRSTSQTNTGATPGNSIL